MRKSGYVDGYYFPRGSVTSRLATTCKTKRPGFYYDYTMREYCAIPGYNKKKPKQEERRGYYYDYILQEYCAIQGYQNSYKYDSKSEEYRLYDLFTGRYLQLDVTSDVEPKRKSDNPKRKSDNEWIVNCYKKRKASK